MTRSFCSWRAASAAASFGVLLAAGACSKAPVRQGRPAVAVTVIPVKRASVPYDVAANGIVTPMQTATVTPQVDGLVMEVNFQEGQEVSRGMILFHLDSRPYQATFNQVTAALARDKATATYAQQQVDRYDALLKEKIVTREQVDQMRATAQSTAATVQADQANLDNAKFNLDNCIVRAPISGRTGGLLVRAGNLVRSNVTSLVVINQVHPILVRFAVPGTLLPLILQYGEKSGRPVALQVTALPATASGTVAPADTATPMDATSGGGKKQAVALAPNTGNSDSQGGLSFVDNAVDTTTATVLLKASFANKGGTLWAGQFVATTLRLFTEENVLVLPTQAVVPGQQGTYVYVIDSSNTAQQRPVTVERAAGGISVISSGVAEGERVVTDGQSRVTPGAQVTIGTRDGTSSTGGPGGPGGRGGRGGRGGGRGRGGRGGQKADSAAAKSPS